MYTMLADVYRLRGEFKQAEELSRKALDMFEAIAPKIAVIAYGELGQVFKDRGDLVQAESWLRKAIDGNEAMGAKRTRLYTLACSEMCTWLVVIKRKPKLCRARL